MTAVRFFNEDGEQVEELDPNDSCNAYYPGDLCGGCGSCLMRQAYHAGFVAIDGDMYPPGYDEPQDEPEVALVRPWAETHDEMQNGWWYTLQNRTGETT